MDAQTLLADGFEEAFIGVGRKFNRYLAVYDVNKCIQIVIDRDGMDRDEAIEFLEFNTLGAWMGDLTPVFLDTEVTLESAIDSALHAPGGDLHQPGEGDAEEAENGDPGS